MSSARIFLAAAALAAPLALGACTGASAAEDRTATFYADAVRIGDGTARVYMRQDARGVPTELGVELSEAALAGLPRTPVMMHIPVPAEAARVTQYRFVMFDWNPQGHEPEHVWTIPHFDFHFYMADEAEVMRIPGGSDSVLPDARYVPADYLAPPNGLSIPKMGAHWTDRDTPEFHGRTFDQTFLWGYDKGVLMFIEPMITRAMLLSRPNFVTPLKQPAAYQHPGYYPLRYSIRHDSAARVVRVALEQLTRR